MRSPSVGHEIINNRYNNNSEIVVESSTSVETDTSPKQTDTLVECVLCNKKVSESSIQLLTCSVKCVDYFRVCSACIAQDDQDKSTVDFSFTDSTTNTTNTTKNKVV